MAIIEGYARPAPVDAQMIPISTVTTEYAPEVKPGKPDMGLDPDYTPPSTFDFGTVTEKPTGEVKPGKPDMGLMPDEQIEERAEPMDVTGDDDAPAYDWTLRGIQIIPKETNIAMFALGAFTLYVVGHNLISVVRR